MRLSKAEVERRKKAVFAYFQANPTASVAKMNAALTSGALTGQPERMLNIAKGYAWRKEALAAKVEDAVAPVLAPLVGETVAAAQEQLQGVVNEVLEAVKDAGLVVPS